MFEHELNFDCANLIFAAVSPTLLKVIHVLVVFISCMLLSVYGSCPQLFIGPFDMTAVSQYL